MSLDHKGLSARKRDILEYLKIYDSSNHTAVAWVLLAGSHEELDAIIRRLKRDGRYFEKEYMDENVELVVGSTN